MLHAESLKQAPKSVRFKERLASTVGLNVRSTTPNKHAITDSQSPTTPINEHKSKSIKKPKTFDECFKNAVDFAQNAKS